MEIDRPGPEDTPLRKFHKFSFLFVMGNGCFESSGRADFRTVPAIAVRAKSLECPRLSLLALHMVK